MTVHAPSDQRKRDAYLDGKVMPIFDIEVTFRAGELCISSSFNNIGDMVNWAIQQAQSISTVIDNLALYGVQRKIEDDF